MLAANVSIEGVLTTVFPELEPLDDGTAGGVRFDVSAGVSVGLLCVVDELGTPFQC
jgi:hypothetical protein